jgi:ribosomal protein S18 acetylase RimI-like enzyme
MINIRPALPDDADAIAALATEVQAIHARALPKVFKAAGPLPAPMVRELIAQQNTVVLVACAGNRVIGYAHAEVQRREENSYRFASSRLFVHGMAVAEKDRRLGAGRRLLDGLCECASADGITRIELDVWAFNAEARMFYKRIGFRPSREFLVMDIEPG